MLTYLYHENQGPDVGKFKSELIRNHQFGDVKNHLAKIMKYKQIEEKREKVLE